MFKSGNRTCDLTFALSILKDAQHCSPEWSFSCPIDSVFYLFIYLFNNIYTGSKYQLQKLFFLQSPV